MIVAQVPDQAAQCFSPGQQLPGNGTKLSAVGTPCDVISAPPAGEGQAPALARASVVGVKHSSMGPAGPALAVRLGSVVQLLCIWQTSVAPIVSIAVPSMHIPRHLKCSDRDDSVRPRCIVSHLG